MQLFLCSIVVLVSAFSFSQLNQTISFTWSDDSLGGIPFEKTAVFIPVRLEGNKFDSYFQLDTGSDRSYFYCPTTDSGAIDVPCPTVQSVNTNLGNIEFLSTTTNSPYIQDNFLVIGTIGADIFHGSCVEFDFPHQKITFLSIIDTAQYYTSVIEESFGRPVLHVVINGKNNSFLFDTGSSLFDIWTTKKKWRKWRAKDAPVEYPISSWGEINPMYQSTFNTEIQLDFNASIAFESVWYNSNKAFEKSFRGAGVDGIIGIKPFLDQIIVIDMQSNLFGIKKRP